MPVCTAYVLRTRSSTRHPVSLQDDNSCIDALFLRILIIFFRPGSFSAGLSFFLVVACCGVHEMVPDFRGGGAGAMRGCGRGRGRGRGRRRGRW